MNSTYIISGTTPNFGNIISVLKTIKYVANDFQKNNSFVEVSSDINTDIDYYKNVEYKGYYHPSILKRDIDIYPWRAYTDIVIQGTAKSDNLVKRLVVNLRCSGNNIKLNKNIIVTGDRWIECKPLKITEPKSFTEMAIRYDNAYGGTDEIAENKHTSSEELQLMRNICGDYEDREFSEYSYPRNPSGKGYIVDYDGIDGLQLPNLEFSDDRLTLTNVVAPRDEWGKRPYPACFDWLPHAWFPRVAFFGDFPPTFDGKVPQKEIEMGLLDKDLHLKPLLERPKHGLVQGSHPYLLGNRFQGDEEIRITHMSKDGRDFHIKLPNYIPKIKIRLFGGKKQYIKPELDLVFIETEKETVTLLWRGSVPVEKDFLPPNWEEQCEYTVDW